MREKSLKLTFVAYLLAPDEYTKNIYHHFLCMTTKALLYWETAQINAIACRYNEIDLLASHVYR